MASSGSSARGALVISLDFELHWGVRDRMKADGPYRRNLFGARSAVPRMLKLFREFDVAATWATVGFLFARNRDELMDFSPSERPRYHNVLLDPWRELIGRNEAEDPLHFAPSLLETIRATDRQEIASHTFSHYYCLESGQNAAAFRADLTSARNIASATLGLNLRSLVLPRNQFNPAYAGVIQEAGFLCCRGNQSGGIHAASDFESMSASFRRAARLADAYLPLVADCLPSWPQVSRGAPLCDVQASRYLRPWNARLSVLDPLRAHRIIAGMRAAARNARIYHLWWHPHDFGAHLDESIAFLSRILTEFRVLRDRFGFQSMSMAEAAETASGAAADVPDPTPSHTAR